jgi:hypothetical protein
MVFREILVAWGNLDWIELNQDRDKWRSLVNIEINFGLPKF